MPYSVDDKCKKLAKCPEAAAIITEYSPGFTTVWTRSTLA